LKTRRWWDDPLQTEAARLRGTEAYFRSEEVWEEECYYNGWDEPDSFRKAVAPLAKRIRKQMAVRGLRAPSPFSDTLETLRSELLKL
jgi:hypothetical protein